MEIARVLFSLTKLPITCLVSLTTAAGYASFRGAVDRRLIASALGILLLASASAVLNHVQEQDIDSQMARTKNRPLPSGRISTQSALFLSCLLSISASLILWFTSRPLVLILGLFTLFCYNGVYTPLKRLTPFAAIPGAIVGALPPIIGWVSAGGGLVEREALVLGFFYFLWQIPHFWLLLLLHGDEYEQAGLPSLNSVFTEKQSRCLSFVWLSTAAFSSLLFPLSGMMIDPYICAALYCLAILLILQASPLLMPNIGRPTVRRIFFALNLFVLLVSVLLCVG